MNNFNYKLFISISVLFLTPFLLIAQKEIAQSVSGAIKKGDVKELSFYFNNTIDLTIAEKDGTFSKSQAEVILDNFFTSNPPTSFTLNHKGDSKDGSFYAIGKYISDKVEYRVYYLIKNINNKPLIQQLRFEIE